MTSIKLMLTGTQAWALVTGPLTSGMVGLPVTIECDEAWDGLTKNLMCRCSPWGSNDGEIRTILNVGETATVAHEVMQPDMYLHLGVEGFSGDGKLVIPTTWARCGKIEYGANTSEDLSTDPELSIWNQLQIEMEQTKEYVLTPEQAADIQAYAREATESAQEAKQAAEEAKQAAQSGLYYIPSVSQPTDNTLKFEFKPSITGAPAPKPVTVELPDGNSGGGSVESDTTLTQSGKAADAKAVGDALAKLDEKLAVSGSIVLSDVTPGEQFTVIAAVTGNADIVVTGAFESVDVGGVVEFGVALAAAPAEDQTVYLSVSNSAVSLDMSALVFTPENYGAAQTVTVTVAEDAESGSCTIYAASSGVSRQSFVFSIVGEEPEVTASKYTYVFDVKSSVNSGKTLNLVKNPGGSGGTDWGDGTVDEELTHTYADYGVYTVVTDNTLASDTATRQSLTRVESMSSALMVDSTGNVAATGMFASCQSLIYACDIPVGYAGIDNMFQLCKLQNAPKIPHGVTTANGAFWNAKFSIPPEIPSTLTVLQNMFRSSQITEAPILHGNVTNVQQMCQACSQLVETHEPWDTVAFAGAVNAYNCFEDCAKLDLSTVPTTWGGTMEVSA